MSNRLFETIVIILVFAGIVLFLVTRLSACAPMVQPSYHGRLQMVHVQDRPVVESLDDYYHLIYQGWCVVDGEVLLRQDLTSSEMQALGLMLRVP